MSPAAARALLAAVVLLIVAVIAALVLARTGGELLYSLDDPYIHLALARNLAAGHYGINLSEYSAPSSSLLWPLLLAPLAGSAIADALPLLINTACLIATALLLLRFFSLHARPATAALLSLVLLWSLNLFGLVFTGMEHSLQLLLVTLVVVAVSGVRLPRGLLMAALVLLPWVRYEDLAISLPMLLWLAADRPRRDALLALLAMLAGLAAFSLFLHHLGLGWLPSSVLAKQPSLMAGDGNRAALVLLNLIDNYSALLIYATAVLMAVLTPALVRREPARLAVLATATLLILAFGRHGWFGRYEVHLAMFISLMLASSLLPLLKPGALDRAALALGVSFLAANAGLWMATLRTPAAAANIHEQQAQMAVIVRDHLRAPVAVNDLGLVAWRGGQPVLDLYGLGSVAALRARQADGSGAWIAPMLAERGVEFVMIYAEWFPRLPLTWTLVGELRLATPRSSVAGEVVSFYASSPEAATRMRTALKQYRAASPLGARLLRLR